MTGENATLADLERQIEQTREELGRTVEELAAKADVPARAKAKAAETAERVRASARRVARHREGGSAPPVVTLSPELSGSHIAGGISPSAARERRAYGAAALALTAATAGAAVWAARRPS